jgi:pimeloyl-ACP methyl ester carboxylesterase
MEIVHYGNSQAYVFKNESSDKLIINIDGHAWDSVLGTKNERRWLHTYNGAQFLQVLRNGYTFLIPEKFSRQPGISYYDDMQDRANYTAENILNCYIESINGYLAEHSFSDIVIIGSSEGALLLPLIYEGMNDKGLVKALVSISFGGFSLYESYLILSARQNVPPDYRAMYLYFLETFKPGKAEYPNSFEEDVYNLTYRWLNSFKDIRPLDYYKNIDIPILFIHGEFDYRLPVDSTFNIQIELPKKPFEYRYYKWGHQPEKYFDTLQVRNDVADWINKILANTL